MARKRTNKPLKYTIQHGKLQHNTSARRFVVWLRAGLIVLETAHRARVSEIARTVWESGELFLTPKAAPAPSIRTNAEVIDRQYLLANAGQIPVTREDRQRFADWRIRFGWELAAEMEAEFLANKRQWDMRRQYGW